ncbi:MAG: helix-turn-helix domain-containing protein [Patescibacteria group bacterium]
MKTIGEYLKEARVKKRFSQEKIAKETKIKEDFISSIEKENWESLPEFPIVVGFVKGIAKFLKVDERQAVALLRRDYPPKVLPVNPKPDVSKTFTWTPRLTFILGITIVALVILGYLGFQYSNFIRPPKLFVERPLEGEVVKEEKLTVFGRTDPDVTVKVNNQPVLVEDNGTFETEIEIFEGTEEIVIKAVSRSGKETTVQRKIKPEIEK